MAKGKKGDSEKLLKAIIDVLSKSKSALHYTEIADEIIKENKINLGATPSIQVNNLITKSLREATDKNPTPFVRVDRGKYSTSQINFSTKELLDEEESDAGLIKAFGMFWSRRNVLWENVKPKIYGQQSSKTIDFCEQRGVYLLHDGKHVIYVGRTTDQPLGVRLKQHITDRLNGRWDRFSWFGICAVSNEGIVQQADSVRNYSIDLLISTMEALLIEGLEPPQNRRGGDGLRAIEFLQSIDPDIESKQREKIIKELLNISKNTP